MRRIRVEPLGITIEIKNGQTLQEGLQEAGILVENPCGGMGSCGTCGVWVDPVQGAAPTPNRKISPQMQADGFRLACQTVPLMDITVRLMDNYAFDRLPQNRTERVLSHGDTAGETKISPAAGIQACSDGFYLAYEGRSPVRLDWWPKGRPALGLAIDIGTTTIVLSLVSLDTGQILASRAGLNPQVAHGHDVLSRIQYARTAERQKEMADLVQNLLNAFIDAVCAETGSVVGQIVDVCIGANTTMLQLAAGMDSASIGQAPFNYDIRGGRIHPAALFGLKTNPVANVYLPPILHAYVGTDISAGLLLSPEFFDPEKVVLFLDMGTNGEMCLNVKGRWYTTSTAAGPAFEGMGLSSGMRARDGAIEKVTCQEGRIGFKTVNDAPVKGLCGSGIVDLIAVLLALGVVDGAGRLKRENMPPSHVADLAGVAAFALGNEVYLTQKDVRQIQLAKSAIRTGVEMILKAGGVMAGDLDRIYLAGGFGNHLNPFNLEKIGLFPAGTAHKVIFCGNASVDGARLLLTNHYSRRLLEKNLDGMSYVALTMLPEFNSQFVANLNFSP